MSTNTIISRRLKIDKANTTVAAFIAIAAFVVVFSLVASKSLISQYQYQSKIINTQQTTVNQLNTDQSATTPLINAYEKFVGKTTNIIGGSSTGNTGNNGNNAKIVLDALPSSYDFPALVTSIQNILNQDNVMVIGITGTDTSGTATSTTAAAPAPASLAPPPTSPKGVSQIPFTISVSGSYMAMQNVINSLQNSIRPISVQNITFTGTDSNLTMDISAITYYQNATGLKITTETIK